MAHVDFADTKGKLTHLTSYQGSSTYCSQGWTGPKELDGKIIEGSFHSHQVPLPKANSDDTQLKALKDWLSSYKINQLLEDGKPTDAVIEVLPKNDEKKLGQIKATYDPYVGLKAVDWKEYAVEKGADKSCMQVVGKFLDKVFQENPTTIRLFSPDELESNKLNAVLDHTQRNFQWDEYSRANGGRVIETLSEHSCQGFMQGYTLTGRTAIFPSYESFLGIVHTMMVQYSKFVKIAREVKWRGDLPSINYIETRTWTRQEHNGFSHQNPSFIGSVINIKAEAAIVCPLPPLPLKVPSSSSPNSQQNLRSTSPPTRTASSAPFTTASPHATTPTS
jgi:xylulose-5-phosphate/fructose-6-phosphate phosphoketolase